MYIIKNAPPKEFYDIVKKLKSQGKGHRESISEAKFLYSPLKKSKKRNNKISDYVQYIDPKKILSDPKRFQYKVIGELTESGNTGSLDDSKRYNQELAGILQVWKDPKNGNAYVVNGHNRLILAKKSGEPAVLVRFLKAESDAEARAIGALSNIAEGKGTSIDAAKFFRDSSIDIAEYGLNVKDRFIKDGRALSKLPRFLFDMVIDGKIEEYIGIAIGESGLETEQKMLQLYEMIFNQMRKGKNVNREIIEETVEIMRALGTTTKKITTLFGEDEVEENYLFERARLAAAIKKRIAKEKKVFGVAAKNENLLSAVGEIDAKKSLQISKKANIFLRAFDDFKNTLGTGVSEELNSSAKKIKMAKNKDIEKITNDAYVKILEKIKNILPKEIMNEAH